MRWLLASSLSVLSLLVPTVCVADETSDHNGILRLHVDASPIEGIDLPEVVTVRVELRGETEQRIETEGSPSDILVIALPEDPSAQGISAEIRIDAPGFWGPSLPLLLTERETTARIRLHPTGELRGQVIAEEATLPETLAVHFRSAPGPEETPLESEHSIECPIEDGKLRCQVPAGSLDLRFRARGFVSVHRWGFDLPPHQTRNIGRLVLRRGASVVGWVVASGEEFQPESASVVLTPKTTLESRRPETREREESFRHQTRPNERGFFQLAGIPAGSYYAVVRHPGFAPSRMEPILVREGLELELPDRCGWWRGPSTASRDRWWPPTETESPAQWWCRSSSRDCLGSAATSARRRPRSTAASSCGSPTGSPRSRSRSFHRVTPRNSSG